MTYIQYVDGPVSVALLAEGVDRNIDNDTVDAMMNRSPSSRRAWIEIPFRSREATPSASSPSSRRAWIEIGCT